MSTLESRILARTITPEPDDPAFDICIAARQAMTQPCHFHRSGFFGPGYTDQFGIWHETACWMGHILKASNGGKIGLPEFANELIVHIARKLGFPDYCVLYHFNDRHTHAEVIAEFDRRLQEWQF